MKVFLAMPSYLGHPAKETRQSLRNAREALTKAGIPHVFATQEGVCYICQARNILVKSFMETDCTDFVFIDDDVSFQPDALLKLLATPHPIVAGIYRKKMEPVSWPVNLIGPLVLDENGCAEAHMLPTGFMRIKREVFETLRSKVPHYKADQYGDLVAYFMTGIRNGLFWGEDVAFTSAWRQAGGKLWALLDVTLGHTSAKDGRTYRGNLAHFIAEQTRRAA